MSQFEAVLRQGMEEGLHVGAQACVHHGGKVMLDLAIGQARLEPAAPMTPDTLMLWLSAGKPITAAAILMLCDAGQLRLEDEVARHIPEFAANGKETITIRHLLTHTAGIRGLDAQYPFLTWDETLAKIYQISPERAWLPGMKAGYHIHTSWYVLGELIRRVTGISCDAWVREHIFLPLGMKDSYMAMDAATYEAYGPRVGCLYDTTRTPAAPIPNYDTALAASRPRPSASCRGPMHDLARFYEMLRRGGELDGTRLVRPETVAAMTMRQRVGLFDQTFQKTIDWGLGIIINSAHYGPGIPYQFGPAASPDTFGHGGSQTSTGFCDPRRGLVVALLFNGACGEPAHDRRLRAALAALYEDLSLK